MTVAVQKLERVLPEFTMDHLGTSFRVILVDSVREVRKGSKEPEVFIPDQHGLHKAIATKRASDPRKLTGGDIKFLRKTLGMKSKDLANTLDISPEYLSRCEAGEKTMASNVEKMLRLIVLLEPYYVLEKASEEGSADIKRSFERLRGRMDDVMRVVHEMRIIPARALDDEVVYHFERRKRSVTLQDREVDAANDDDCEWLKIACGGRG